MRKNLVALITIITLFLGASALAYQSPSGVQVPNTSAPTFRTDLNQSLLAIDTTNAGINPPSYLYSGELWYDISTNPAVLKIRDSSNTIWIPVLTGAVAVPDPLLLNQLVGIGVEPSVYGYNLNGFYDLTAFNGSESALTLNAATTTLGSNTINSGVTCGPDTYGRTACGDFRVGHYVMSYGSGSACNIPGTSNCTTSIPTAVVKPIGLTTVIIPPSSPGNWVASTAYLASQYAKPTVSNAGNYIYKAQANCTSGTPNPTWNQTVNTTTADNAGGGTCNWTNVGLANQVTMLNWVADLSVRSNRERYSYSPVVGSPVTGQYSVSSGVYTFSNSDAYQKIQIRYTSTSTPGTDIVQVQAVECDGGVPSSVGTSGCSKAGSAVTYFTTLLPMSPINGLNYSVTPNGTAVVNEATGVTYTTATGTLANLPVERNTVSFTNGTTTVTDDGYGTLISSGVASAGWIDYRTGSYSVTFPIVGPITASYTYGVMKYYWYANYNGTGYFPVGATWSPSHNDYGQTTRQKTDSAGIGDGSTKTFSVTLTKLPVIKTVAGGTVVVSSIVGGSTVTGTDNGSGIISGTGVSGTVGYSNGVFSVTFTTAPDANKGVNVTYLAANPILGEDIPATPPATATSQTYLGQILSISGNNLVMDNATQTANTGTAKLYHDDTTPIAAMLAEKSDSGGMFNVLSPGHITRIRQINFNNLYGVHLTGAGREHEAKFPPKASKMLCVSDGGGTMGNPGITNNTGPAPGLNGCITYGNGSHDTLARMQINYNNGALIAVIGNVGIGFNGEDNIEDVGMNNDGSDLNNDGTPDGALIDSTVGTATRGIWVAKMGTSLFQDIDIWGMQSAMFIGNGTNQLAIENGTMRAAMPSRYFNGIIDISGSQISNSIRNLTFENVWNGIHIANELTLESGSIFSPLYSADQGAWEGIVAPFLPSGEHISSQGRSLIIDGGLSSCLPTGTGGGIHILHHISVDNIVIQGMQIQGCLEPIIVEGPATVTGTNISVITNGIGIDARGNGNVLTNNQVAKTNGATNTTAYRLGFLGDEGIACASSSPNGTLNHYTPTTLPTDITQTTCVSNNVVWSSVIDGVNGGMPVAIAESGGGTIGVFSLVNLWEKITVADNSAFTIPLPTNSSAGQAWHIELDNNAGATTGTITLASGYQKDSSFTSTIASGKTRVCNVNNQAAGVPVISSCVDW